MPPENDEELYDQLPEDHPVLKALRAERTRADRAERQAKVSAVISRFPQAGLTEEDFEGLTPDKFEARATRIAALAATAAPTPTTPEPDAAPSPTEDAFARAAAITEGVPPVTGGKKLGRDEAWALMKRNPAEYERLRQAGRIDLGVTPEDRGGSVIFHPGV